MGTHRVSWKSFRGETLIGMAMNKASGRQRKTDDEVVKSSHKREIHCRSTDLNMDLRFWRLRAKKEV